VLGPVEREMRDFAFAPKLDELKLVELGHCASKRPEYFGAMAVADHSDGSEVYSLDRFIRGRYR
jgi:hypothetical protein